MIRNIIFDIGGVLVDYDWKTYLKSFHFPAEKEETIARATFLGKAWSELDREALSIDEITAMMTAAAPQYTEDILTVFHGLRHTIHRRDYACGLIRSLRERGLKVYYLSNYSSHTLGQTREALDFLPLMDGGLFSYEVKQVKPEPEIFASLLARYPDILPGESVFFDDSSVNIEAARRLGFHGIVFGELSQAMAELAPLLHPSEPPAGSGFKASLPL